MKRRSHHRPSPRLFLLVVGAIITSSLLYAPSTSALAVPGLKTDRKAFTSPLKENNDKIEQLNKTFALKKEKLENKQKIVEKVKLENSEVAAVKDDLAKRIDELKAQIAELDDMFVHIASYAGNAAGNDYAAGNCTWYAKSMRPDIPNTMGNANAWYSAAAAQGFKVGTKAKVGAIATTTEGWAGHVAYVEKVSRDGSKVTISEMNYGGLYQMNTRTVAASTFKYIYEKP